MICSPGPSAILGLLVLALLGAAEGATCGEIASHKDVAQCCDRSGTSFADDFDVCIVVVKGSKHETCDDFCESAGSTCVDGSDSHGGTCDNIDQNDDTWPQGCNGKNCGDDCICMCASDPPSNSTLAGAAGLGTMSCEKPCKINDGLLKFLLAMSFLVAFSWCFVAGASCVLCKLQDEPRRKKLWCFVVLYLIVSAVVWHVAIYPASCYDELVGLLGLIGDCIGLVFGCACNVPAIRDRILERLEGAAPSFDGTGWTNSGAGEGEPVDVPAAVKISAEVTGEPVYAGEVVTGEVIGGKS